VDVAKCARVSADAGRRRFSGYADCVRSISSWPSRCARLISFVI
jgi:hypothetical protein